MNHYLKTMHALETSLVNLVFEFALHKVIEGPAVLEGGHVAKGDARRTQGDLHPLMMRHRMRKQSIDEEEMNEGPSGVVWRLFTHEINP